MRLVYLFFSFLFFSLSVQAHTSRCHLMNNSEIKVFELQVSPHKELQLNLPSPYSVKKALKTPEDFSFQKDSRNVTTGIYLHYTSDEGHRIQGLIDYGNSILVVFPTDFGASPMNEFKYFCPHQVREPTGEITIQTFYGIAPYLAPIVAAPR